MCYVAFSTIFSKHIHTYDLMFSSKDILSDKTDSLSLVASKKRLTKLQPPSPPVTQGDTRSSVGPACLWTIVHFSFHGSTLSHIFFTAFCKEKKGGEGEIKGS